jgi:Leucine-rich repeat (LRR) protein
MDKLYEEIQNEEIIDLSSKRFDIMENFLDDNYDRDNMPALSLLMEKIPFEKFKSCKNLSLRKNHIQYLIELPDFLNKKLEKYDLYDNEISELKYFSSFKCLRILDLSYNKLTKISGLDDLANTLEELYLIHNELIEVSGLDKLINLKILELGDNEIYKINYAFDNLVNLRELYLGSNNLDTKAIQNKFNNLNSLELFSCQSNLITSLDNIFTIENNPNLKYLYIGQNPINSITGIENINTLLILDLDNTLIEYIDDNVLNKKNFPLLEDIYLTRTKIEDIEELKKLLTFDDKTKIDIKYSAWEKYYPMQKLLEYFPKSLVLNSVKKIFTNLYKSL